jgi:hypothetical protein
LIVTLALAPVDEVQLDSEVGPTGAVPVSDRLEFVELERPAHRSLLEIAGDVSRFRTVGSEDPARTEADSDRNDVAELDESGPLDDVDSDVDVELVAGRI